MSLRKLVPLAVVLMMAVPAVVVFTPAAVAQQETVPIASGVNWAKQTAFEHKLYLRYPNAGADGNSAVPDCTATASSDPRATLRFTPASPPRSTARGTCAYPAGVSGQSVVAGTASFAFPTALLHSFNVSGNTALFYYHDGLVPSGVRMTVEVYASDRLAGTGTWTGRGNSQNGDYAVPIQLGPSSLFEFRRGETVTVRIFGTAPTDSNAIPTSAPTWQVADTGSRLQIISSDTMRAATWTTNELGAVQSLFRPLALTQSTEKRIVGYFAVQSAFSHADARGDDDPQFTLERGGLTQPIGPGNVTYLEGREDIGLSADVEGRAVWKFPAGFLDYRGMSTGEYNLTVNMPYHQGNAIRDGTRHVFRITTQSVALSAYDDKDPLTPPEAGESLAHELPVGGSTTYLVLVNNTGSVNDTFRLDAVFVSSSSTGWSAVVGGPDVQDRRIALRPLESKLVTLTVNAPAGAAVGATSIFQLTAVSALDPTAAATPVTVVSTVSNLVRHEVAVITPSAEVNVDPDEPLRLPVHVWNRGTRTANVSLEIQEAALGGWVARIATGDTGVARVLVPNVKPGDIARVDLLLGAPINQPDGTHTITLNATHQDVGGVSGDTPLKLIAKPTSSVRLQILQQIAGMDHYIELTSDGLTSPTCVVDDSVSDACNDDGADGTWFRLWITNTGKRTDTFDLRTDSLDWAVAPNDCTDEAFLPREQNDQDFTFYFRGPAGQTTSKNSVSLAPGETGELYIWRSVDRTASECNDRDTGVNHFRFVVEAKGRETGAVARAVATAIAENGNGDRRNAVLIEAVERAQLTYAADHPLVDITNARERRITKPIGVNETQTYYVRVTNGAAWGEYTDSRLRQPLVHVQLEGVDKERGWNVSIRNATGERDILKNPYSDNVTIFNNHNSRVETWFDQELEIVVQAPSAENGTALAGERDSFTLRASIPGTDKVSTLEITSIIAEKAVVNVTADAGTLVARQNGIGAVLLYVNNSGSYRSDVTLRARMDPGTTPNANAWQVEPASQTFPLEAFKNRTVALIVTPPSGAAAGEVEVTIEYPATQFDKNDSESETIRVPVQVVPAGALKLTHTSTDATIAPGGFANFTMTLENTATGASIDYRLTGTLLPNWTQTLSPTAGTLAPGEKRTVVYVLKAPSDVVNDSRFSSLLRVHEVGNDANFDVKSVTVNILGGKAIPAITVPKTLKTVDRDDVQRFEVNVKNVGSAAGRIDFTTRTGDANWASWVETLRGERITHVTLQPNELQTVNVTVEAPRNVIESTLVPVEFLAESGGQAARANLQALIHDYTVKLELNPPRVDAIAGRPVDFTVRLRNDGNDNDTLNLSAILDEMPNWRVDLAAKEVRLEPGQSTDIRATVIMPSATLPTPRAYTFKFYSASVDGLKVNVSKNETISAVVNVLNYRSIDVDGDGVLELAVDQDKDSANGFEKFHEISADGVQSTVTATGRWNGKTTFFLDSPRDKPYDGIADVWLDPETVYAYKILYAPDLNNDATPDYLLDTNRDGKVDRAYDTVGLQFWTVQEVKSYGDERLQFLVDVVPDNVADRFYDPAGNDGKGLVTRTQRVAGDKNLLGLDTNNDGRVDKHYDIKSEKVAEAAVSNVADFGVKYWYFFAGFAILLLVTIVLVVRRSKKE